MPTIQVASDLHFEWLQARFYDAPLLEVSPEADVVILAGDISVLAAGLPKMRQLNVPVVYVAGNHEFYGGAHSSVVQMLRARAGGNIHFLENDVWEYKGIRFLGATLWSDYALNGDADASKRVASALLVDHRRISRDDGGRFTPEDALALHRQSRQWLVQELAKPFDGKTVVVTHHGPHPSGVALKYCTSPLNPAFHSDMRSLMPQVDLWAFGHTHTSVDLQEGRCRVVANPRGYPVNRNEAESLSDVHYENTSWDPSFLVKL